MFLFGHSISTMGQYSIKDIELLSGIKAHTLRIWEQRYDFITPLRTDSNIRYYSDDQLKAILNIALLNRHGYKISKIAEMAPSEIREHILGLMEGPENTSDGLLDGLILAMVDFDEARFEKTLNTAIVKMGFAEAFEQLILPFLERTGMMWATGLIKPIQEHFMSNLIRRKLSVAIDNQYTSPDQNTRKFTLLLPEGEWHDLMLLYTDYSLRSRNHHVLYLGTSVPMDDIFTLQSPFRPDYLVMFITSPISLMPIQDFVNRLSESYPDLTIMIGGRQIISESVSLPHNVIYIDSLPSMLDVVSRKGATVGKLA